MKITITSDIHSNYSALLSLRDMFDEIWVLGDLVNYGPQPSEVVDFVRSKATIAVRGNHDQAVAFSQDPRSSPQFRVMAKETQKFSESVLKPGEKSYLGSLPLRVSVERGGARFYLCHATPTDPLYAYCQGDSERWIEECDSISADFLLVGHTHVPFVRKIGECTVVNPGSLGQPKTGKPDACYAVWEDGNVELKSFEYPVNETVARIRALGLSRRVKNDLVHVLETGGAR